MIVETFQVPDVTPTPDKAYASLEKQREGLQVVIEQLAEAIGVRLTVQEKLLAKIKRVLSSLINKRLRTSGDTLIRPIDRISSVVQNRIVENNIRYDTVRNIIRTQPPVTPPRTSGTRPAPFVQPKQIQPDIVRMPASQPKLSTTIGDSVWSQTMPLQPVTPTNSGTEYPVPVSDGSTQQQSNYTRPQAESQYPSTYPQDDTSFAQSETSDYTSLPPQTQSQPVKDTTLQVERLQSLPSVLSPAVTSPVSGPMGSSQDTQCDIPQEVKCTPLEGATQAASIAFGQLANTQDLVNDLSSDTPLKGPPDEETNRLMREWDQWLSRLLQQLLGSLLGGSQ